MGAAVKQPHSSCPSIRPSSFPPALFLAPRLQEARRIHRPGARAASVPPRRCSNKAAETHRCASPLLLGSAPQVTRPALRWLPRLKTEEFNPKVSSALGWEHGGGRCSSTPPHGFHPTPGCQKREKEWDKSHTGRIKRPKIIPAGSNASAGQSDAGVGRAGGAGPSPKHPPGREGWRDAPKPPKIPQNRRGGGRGRHICNNLLTEAIIDTGKTRGGPCSATCLVFCLFGEGVGGWGGGNLWD